MYKNIDNQIDVINKAVNFINSTDRRDDNNTRRKLVEIRRTLKQIKYAKTVKPAVAVYGASQVGKSYLVDTLLKDRNGELEIVAGKNGEEEQTYSFLKYLDPMGGGAESTSVISRFTTDKYKWPDDDFPVKAKIMSVVDVVLILCDSYYNDIKDKKTYSTDEITAKIDAWTQKYGNKQHCQNILTDDDVYEIEEYLTSDKNFQIKLREIQDLKAAEYFDKVSLFIGCVPEDEWCEVLSILWGEVEAISDVFVCLLKGLHKLQFNREVFIPIESLFRDKGTLLSVDRLDEFFGIKKTDEKGDVGKENYVYDVDVYIADNNVVTMTKGEFCALSIEYVLCISSSAAEDKTFMKDVKCDDGTVRSGSDVLDFPGARSREVIYLKDLTDSHVNENGEIITPENNKCTMLKRGKIAYLFNKYTDQYLINSLLACYENKQNEVNTLPGLIASWVKKMVGENSSERERRIAEYKMSPLFIVGTKYNLDMQINQINEVDGDYSDIDKRWENRFVSFLCKGIIRVDNFGSWFNDWTTSRKLFNNIYLLRSFKYSREIFNELTECTECDKCEENRIIGKCRDCQKMYKGKYKEHLDKLKESFVNYSFVKKYLGEEAVDLWNDCSTPFHDGSERIIKNLTVVTQNAGKVRDDQFLEIEQKSYDSIIEIIDPMFRTGKEGDLIKEAIQTAGEIKMSLDIFFHNNPDMFSTLIGTMHVGESELHDLILKELNNPDIIQKAGIALLMMIRLNANINDNDNTKSALDKIIDVYHFPDERECLSFLESKGISIDNIINYCPSKSFATIIGEIVEKYWFENVLAIENVGKLGCDNNLMVQLISKMKALYKKLGVTEIIIDTITPYVADPASTIGYVEMLADISSEIINRFVNEMGYSYYDRVVTKDGRRKVWDDLIEANQRYNLNLNLEKCLYEEDDQDENKRGAIAEVFKIIDNPILTQDNMNLLPNVKSLIKWERLMELCFVATCSIPTYNIEENEIIREILLKLDPDNEKYK